VARPKKPKPQTEIDLDAMQAAYLLEPQNPAVFNPYFLLLKVYARSICLKEIKNKIYLEPDRVEEVAVEATLKLLHQYRKAGWHVWGSFYGALRWKVIEALYQDAEEDSTSSLNLTIGDGSVELGDILARVGGSALWQQNIDDPQEAFFLATDISLSEIRSVLDDARNELTPRQEILFYAYLLLKLRRPKAKKNAVSFEERFLSNKEEEAFELLLLEIRNRVAVHC